MKKYIIALLCTVFAFSFTACNDDDDENTEWKDNNEDFYYALADNKNFDIVSLPGAPDAVYRRIIKSGDPSGTKPYQTSTIKALYHGYFYDGTVFDSGTRRQEVLHEQNPELYGEPNPATFKVNGVVSGFGIALQNMVPGDRWEIWIPWPLGYGSKGYSSASIEGYTTLGFEVELVEISVQ